jgi:hypothetical protein
VAVRGGSGGGIYKKKAKPEVSGARGGVSDLSFIKRQKAANLPPAPTVRGAARIGPGDAETTRDYVLGKDLSRAVSRGYSRVSPRSPLAKPLKRALDTPGDINPEMIALDAAMLLPFGKPGKILKRSGSKRWNNKRLQEIAEREAKEAAAKVAKAAPRTPEEKLVGSLGSARKIRKQQDMLRSRERAVRAEAVDKALLSTAGEEGRRRALEALKGELPKLQFGALKQHKITAADVSRFEQHIRTHPNLRPYEKLNTERALTRVLEGIVPTKTDVKLLKNVFGAEKALEIEQKATNWKRLSESVINLVNVPRAMKSSFDVSGIFRQDLLWFVSHPRRAKRNVKPMFQALLREGAYDDLMGQIYSRPNFGRYEKGGLALTDMENLVTREEAFIGANYAEKIPVAGRGVRASGRAYTGLLNQSRADWMDMIIQKAERAGYDVDNEKFLRLTADFVNTATGRGSLASHEAAVKSLNLLLFSPRLIASRVRLLFDPRLYVGTGWEGRIARQEARRSMAALLSVGGAVLTLAHQAGAEVGLDPRSADFGKIKIGDTRIDIWGGLQQYVVASYRMLSGEKVDSATGEVEDVGGFGHTRVGGTLGDLFENKLAPVPSYLNQWDQGRSFGGDDFDPLKEGGKLFLPIGLEQAYRTQREYGTPRAAATFGLNAVGIGVNTYGGDSPKPKRSRGGSGGGGIYGGGSRSRSGGGIYGR